MYFRVFHHQPLMTLGVVLPCGMLLERMQVTTFAVLLVFLEHSSLQSAWRLTTVSQLLCYSWCVCLHPLTARPSVFYGDIMTSHTATFEQSTGEILQKCVS